MNDLVFENGMVADPKLHELRLYLAGAAKIVETVAFEAACDVEPEKVQDLIELACAIEQAAERLRR